MRSLIFRSPHAKVWLADDHSASSYGQPVLLVQIGDAGPGVLGWSDMLPGGLFGWELLERLAAGDLQSLDADARRMFAILLRDVRAWRGASRFDSPRTPAV